MISSGTHTSRHCTTVSGEPAATEAALSENEENSLQTQVLEVSPGSAVQAAFLKGRRPEPAVATPLCTVSKVDLSLRWPLLSVLFLKSLCLVTWNVVNWRLRFVRDRSCWLLALARWRNAGLGPQVFCFGKRFSLRLTAEVTARFCLLSG